MKIIGMVAAMATLFAVLFFASPAQAGVGCYGDWCSGKDPVAMGCAQDARTVATAPIVQRAGGITIHGIDIALGGGAVGQIELRWSDRCQANWARLNLVADVTIRGIVATQDSGYEQVSLTGHYGVYFTRAGVYYTPMIYSPQRHVRAHTLGNFSCPTVSTLWV